MAGSTMGGGGTVCLAKYTPGGKGDRKKGSHSFICPERGDRSDRELVLSLAP